MLPEYLDINLFTLLVSDKYNIRCEYIRSMELIPMKNASMTR